VNSALTRQEKVWDYIVVGTGIGGGTAGLRLAQAGFSVLFLEKGRSPRNQESIQGEFAELHLTELPESEAFQRGGRFHQRIFDATGSRLRQLRPFLGQGVGGSSALYGMVLERFQESDFRNWPISFQTFSKFYAEAEDLFKVRKETHYKHPGNQKLAAFLKEAELTPYSLPLANANNPSCGNCQSVLCKFKCKNDSGKICIEPAIELHKAELITECEVETIDSVEAKITGVTVHKKGTKYSLQGRNVILAGGAILSPLLLKKSVSQTFPFGLGNHSAQVGRNLMRHFVDLYALKIDSDPENPNAKEIGFNDFYENKGNRLGTVQSFGRLPPTEVMLAQLEGTLQSKIAKVLFSAVKPLLRTVFLRQTKGRLVMASIIEDTPQFENRVWACGDKILIHYKISKEDQIRIAAFRTKLKDIFKPLGLLFLQSSEKNEMLAHVCGTCRMGLDPATSVVDLENKVHGTENLFVVDSSFFPTSGGTNPALTIAANALRVAEILVYRERLKEPATRRHHFPQATADRRDKE
jgi:choline dehydrogenase-like flavoprotein